MNAARLSSHRGLTLVELCIGMVVMTMIGSALAGFSLSITTQWRSGDGQRQISVSAEQARRVLASVVQASRAVCFISSTGNPSVLLWQNDAVTADNKIQLGELMLIEFDPTAASIYAYFPNATLFDAQALTTLTRVQAADATVMTLLRSKPWMLPGRTILGTGRADAGAQTTRVTAANFSLVPGTDLPGVQLNATLERTTQQMSVRWVFVLRAAVMTPN
jgi:type II secretory pathway pseudopilin PulG